MAARESISSSNAELLVGLFDEDMPPAWFLDYSAKQGVVDESKVRHGWTKYNQRKDERQQRKRSRSRDDRSRSPSKSRDRDRNWRERDNIPSRDNDDTGASGRSTLSSSASGSRSHRRHQSRSRSQGRSQLERRSRSSSRGRSRSRGCDGTRHERRVDDAEQRNEPAMCFSRLRTGVPAASAAKTSNRKKSTSRSGLARAASGTTTKAGTLMFTKVAFDMTSVKSVIENHRDMDLVDVTKPTGGLHVSTLRFVPVADFSIQVTAEEVDAAQERSRAKHFQRKSTEKQKQSMEDKVSVTCKLVARRAGIELGFDAHGNLCIKTLDEARSTLTTQAQRTLSRINHERNSMTLALSLLLSKPAQSYEVKSEGGLQSLAMFTAAEDPNSNSIAPASVEIIFTPCKAKTQGIRQYRTINGIQVVNRYSVDCVEKMKGPYEQTPLAEWIKNGESVSVHIIITVKPLGFWGVLSEDARGRLVEAEVGGDSAMLRFFFAVVVVVARRVAARRRRRAGRRRR